MGSYLYPRSRASMLSKCYQRDASRNIHSDVLEKKKKKRIVYHMRAHRMMAR